MHPFRKGGWHIYVTGRVIYTKTWYVDRNDHHTMTALLLFCSEKLTCVNTTMLSHTKQWTTWNQKMMTPVTEATISS